MQALTLLTLIALSIVALYFIIMFTLRYFAKKRDQGIPKIETYEVQKTEKKIPTGRKDKKGKPVMKTVIVEQVVEQPAYRPYHALKTNKNKTKIRYWKDKFLDRFLAAKVVLINLELSNGFFKQFLVVEHEGGFVWRKKKYIFDNESKYYILDSRIWAYDFHEEFTLPIKRKIPVASIKGSLEQSGISEVEYATNPTTLERFMTAKIAEGIMRGQQLDVFLKQMRLIGIITMVAVLIHLLIFLQKTGVFAQVKIPGIT